jgi:hypothetical protein
MPQLFKIIGLFTSIEALDGLVLCLYVALNCVFLAVVFSLAVQLECDGLRILVHVHPDPEVVDTL